MVKKHSFKKRQIKLTFIQGKRPSHQQINLQALAFEINIKRFQTTIIIINKKRYDT